VNPNLIRIRYNISDNVFGTNPLNSQCVVEFSGENFRQTDIDAFFKYFVNGFWPHAPSKIIGDNDETKPTLKSNHDLSYMMAIARNVSTWFWHNPNFDFFHDLTSWLNKLSDMDVSPHVYSLSYGSETETSAKAVRDRINSEFQKLGLRGKTLIFPTGDLGTGCYLCYYFEPTFPSSSEYVLSVGSTKFDQMTVGAERATTSFKTGGGFSFAFGTPKYQQDAVSHYLKVEGSLPETHYYNPSGRGMPDISALGTNIVSIQNGDFVYTSSTTTTTPIIAAIITLLNEKRLNSKQPVVGFINPLLYQIYANSKNSFYDVVAGENHFGCCGFVGFRASPGYDVVSGVGTPNFRNLVDNI